MPIIVRLTSEDATLLGAVRDYLGRSDGLYPGIADRWWPKKVVPGLRDGTRTCRAAIDEHGHVIGVLIMKLSRPSTKLCTLHVSEEARGLGVGAQLLAHATEDALSVGASRIHVTAGESVLAAHGGFFEAAGFRSIAWKNGLYVPGESEFVLSSELNNVGLANTFTISGTGLKGVITRT